MTLWAMAHNGEMAYLALTILPFLFFHVMCPLDSLKFSRETTAVHQPSFLLASLENTLMQHKNWGIYLGKGKKHTLTYLNRVDTCFFFFLPLLARFYLFLFTSLLLVREGKMFASMKMPAKS